MAVAEKNWFTLEEIAEYLSFSKEKIYILLREHRIPAVKIGRHWRFSKILIDEWLAAIGKDRNNKVKSDYIKTVIRVDDPNNTINQDLIKDKADIHGQSRFINVNKGINNGVKRRRIVITGLGVIAPNGIGKDNFWKALLDGKSGIKNISVFDARNYSSKIAGEVRDFEPNNYITPKNSRLMDRFSQFAVAASKLALDDAKLDLSLEEDPDKVGLILGSAVGGIPFAEEQHKIFLESDQNLRKVYPLLAIRLFPGTGACQVSIELGIRGYGHTISTGCTSGIDAIAHAYEAILRGHLDVVVTGAAETPLAPLTFGSFCLIKVVSTKRNEDPTKASRPFDNDRDGTVIAEGAAIMILEELGHALKRNANIYGEIVGYGTTYDAYHIAQPLPDGSQTIKAMKTALRNAEVEQVDVVYAHGSSTKLNDAIETRAISNVFGNNSKNIAIVGIESTVGHPLGAAGALKAVACALSIKNDIIPPTTNYEIADPECNLNYTTIKTERKINYGLTNAISFGGKNSSLVMRKLTDS